MIITFCVLFSSTIFAQNNDNIHYKYTQTDSNYTFYGSFKLIALPDCLLKISFNYEHIKALALDAKEVILVDKGENWNQIAYTYQKFHFYENKSEWYRVLDEQNQRIDFKLVKSKNSHSIMPRMISSSGYYKINKQGEYVILEYFQQCQLTKKFMTKLYLNSAKKDAVRFLHFFFDYACEHCGEADSTSFIKPK